MFTRYENLYFKYEKNIYLDKEVFTIGTAMGGSLSSTGTTGPRHSCICAALRDIILTNFIPLF